MEQTTPLQNITSKINSSSNILIIVNDNPSVDALSAALGLTVFLNEINKHATAIFSGVVPPAIAFLDPTKTFEVNTDSLRDFIIALDKEKADHLRYKVDGDMVKIYITPYRTTITKDDLEFSLGDYNVELVIALGVVDQNHIDRALEAHGKILHDATVISVTADSQENKLGSINWNNPSASSLSEMVVAILDTLAASGKTIDKQIATALMTGLVAATGRFSNEKTTSQSMVVAAKLLASGADQQLIAAKLEESHEVKPDTVLPEPTKPPTQPVAAAPTEAPVSETSSLNALENALQGGLIIEHPEKTLEQLSKEIKTNDLREDVTSSTSTYDSPPVETPVYQEPVAVSLPAEPVPTPIESTPLQPAPIMPQPMQPVASTAFDDSYVGSNQPNATINSSMLADNTGPDVDIFSQSNEAAIATQPSAAATVGSPEAELAAVHEVFNEQPSLPPAPQVSLPMPPPLPDFSQLPPPATLPVVDQPLVIGSESPGPVAPDASQYKIPGQ